LHGVVRRGGGRVTRRPRCVRITASLSDDLYSQPSIELDDVWSDADDNGDGGGDVDDGTSLLAGTDPNSNVAGGGGAKTRFRMGSGSGPDPFWGGGKTTETASFNGVYSPSDRPSAGLQTTSVDSVDSLAFHVGLVGIALLFACVHPHRSISPLPPIDGALTHPWARATLALLAGYRRFFG
jgi:hypothetical protein